MADELAILERIQRKVLWLATWMVHRANARPSADATKVGGHQASSASVVGLLTALYFKALRPDDRVAVKAHAAPAFYAIQYLRGRLPRSALAELRSFGGLQAYPSRRKNPEIVDLSTGSMGLGAVQATLGALASRYVADHFGVDAPGRVIVIVGDAELDEGNIWEGLAEELVSGLGRVLWIVDVNRQALDRVVPDSRTRQLGAMFRACGWRVIELRWGRKLRALFGTPEGRHLERRLETMPNAEYQRLLRLPHGAVRKALLTGAGGEIDATLDRFLSRLGDDELAALVADLGGHDLAAILDAVDEAEGEGTRPSVILAHTIKGWGLPLAGDPLNHTMLLTEAQIIELRDALGIAPGAEWDGFAPGSDEAEWVRRLPPLFASPPARPIPEVPVETGETSPAESSTQEAFGRALGALARLPVAAHNLFLLLGALGLTRELSGVTLLPIGTLYDPFVPRGLDALYHALYSGAKFVVVATPSGVSLAPEGGAHQSVITPGIGVALPAIAYFEPAFALEVEWILLDALRGLADRTGESVYLRLSTKPVDQSLAPPPSPEYRARVLRGGYRLIDPRGEPGWDPDENAVHVFAAGAMVPEAVEAGRLLRERGVLASVFVVTSPDRLYRDLRGAAPYLETLVGADEEGIPVVSVLDGHSHALAFIGSALGAPQLALGVDDFGQSGTRADLYRHYGIDAAAIARAAVVLLGG